MRVVTVAPIAKALQQMVSATKERLAFVIEATGLPIIALLPVATSFIGYMTTTIELSLKNAGLAGNPYNLFIQSLPYNFFSIIAILLAFVYTLFGHPKILQGDKAIDAKKDKKIYTDTPGA